MKAVAARREVVRQLQELGLSERQALRLVGMSASTLRYQPRDDGNGELRERLKSEPDGAIVHQLISAWQPVKSAA